MEVLKTGTKIIKFNKLMTDLSPIQNIRTCVILLSLQAFVISSLFHDSLFDEGCFEITFSLHRKPGDKSINCYNGTN